MRQTPPILAGFWRWRERPLSPRIRAASSRRENGFSSSALRKECSSANSNLSHWDPFWTSDVQSCKVIYMYCFKSLSLWYYNSSLLKSWWKPITEYHPYSCLTWFFLLIFLTFIFQGLMTMSRQVSALLNIRFFSMTRVGSLYSVQCVCYSSLLTGSGPPRDGPPCRSRLSPSWFLDQLTHSSVCALRAQEWKLLGIRGLDYIPSFMGFGSMEK